MIGKLEYRFFAIVCSMMSFSTLLSGQETWTKADSLGLNRMLSTDEDIQINPSAKEELDRLFLTPGTRPKAPIQLFPIEKVLFPNPSSLYDNGQSSYRFYMNNLQTYLADSLQKKYHYMGNNRFRFFYSFVNNPSLRVLIQQNIHLQYAISSRFGASFTEGYSIDKNKSPLLPSTATPAYIGAGFYYNINDHIQIKTNVNYQLNVIKKRWEWSWDLGVGAKF